LPFRYRCNEKKETRFYLQGKKNVHVSPCSFSKTSIDLFYCRVCVYFLRGDCVFICELPG
jgi:hypothetical protein